MAHPTKPGSLIGASIRRVEDRPLVSGAGRYVDDLKIAGLLHIAFLRSPHAHARVTRLDVSAARQAPGVVAVFTGAEVNHLKRLPVNQVVPNMSIPPLDYLATERVRAVGVPIVAVVAEERYQAVDATGLIEIEFEPLDAVADLDSALEPNAPRLYDELETNVAYVFKKGAGDVDAAFAAAKHTAKLRLHQPRLSAFPLETRAVAASYDPAMGDLTIWTSTQRPWNVKTVLANIVDLGENHVRVLAPDVGGGFGAKGPVYREEVIAAHVSMQIGRPVKWMGTRSEDFLASIHGRDMTTTIEAAFDENGVVSGLRSRILMNLGGELLANSAMPAVRVTTLTPGPYRIPNVAVETVGVMTNTPSTGPYRGAGRPEAAFAVERIMDEVARVAGIDRIEVRRRNLIRPEEFPFKTTTGLTYDSGNYERALDRALDLADLPGLLKRQQEVRAQGDFFGIGVATFVEPSAGGGWETGQIRIEPSGQVTAITGSSPHGQGHRTAFAQVVADRLSVPFESIVVRHGDTALIPQGGGTGGSRSMTLGGSSLLIASDRVVEKAKRVAGHLLEASPSDVTLESGQFQIAGIPDKSLTWVQVAAAAYQPAKVPPGEEPGLHATALFQPDAETFGFGTYVCAVRIDRDTGELHVEKLVAVDDCGIVVNPLLVEGQVVGGLAQGIGAALREQMTFDSGGQLISGTLMDYAVPTAEDIPHFVLDHTVTPSPLNPLGTKGVGESGTVGAPPAVVNAVVDALSPLGVTNVDMPLTADKLWALVNRTNDGRRGDGIR
ncbi:MAG: xanthine dehydrogenase family protein molybdopterin-binding subunit [Chloroflexi bacterium]|nr:xanthine dehydrogenase family protein molybdopterin-binding subunit [Chloroflexota bacterium]